MGNMFINAFDAITDAHKLEIRDGDHYDSDGLLVCGKCGGRKQARVKVIDEYRTVNCTCPCMQREYEAEKAAEAERQRMRAVLQLKSSGFTDADMQKYTFENDKNPDSIESQVCRRYAESFKDRLKDGKGLLLYGGVGCGKTFLACAVANNVMEQMIPAVATNFTRIANTMQGHFDDRQEFFASFNRFPLMIIDDLGAERKSEYMNEVVYNVIDDRYRAGLPMIITTNMPLEQIKNPAAIEQARIYDRILERCFPIEFAGPSMRRQKIRDEYEDMKKILGYERK